MLTTNDKYWSFEVLKFLGIKKEDCHIFIDYSKKQWKLENEFWKYDPKGSYIPPNLEMANIGGSFRSFEIDNPFLRNIPTGRSG